MIPQKKGDPKKFETDEHPRATRRSKGEEAKPIVKPNGTVTAGNVRASTTVPARCCSPPPKRPKVQSDAEGAGCGYGDCRSCSAHHGFRARSGDA